MRIALLAAHVGRDFTGVCAHVESLGTYLADAGHHVTIAAGTGRDFSPVPRLHPDRGTLHCRVFGIEGALARTLHRSAGMRHWLAEHIREFDIVDLQGIWAASITDAARICLDARIPYIITPHGMMARWDWAKRPVAKRLFFATMLKEPWQRAAAIRFLSEGEKLASVVRPTGSAAVIPHGLAVPRREEWHAAAAAWRERMGIEADAPMVLFFGRITAQKGVLEILEAFAGVAKSYPQARLVLAGPADGDYGAAVCEAAQRHPAASRVHVVGPLYGDEKWAAMAAASIFVTMSKNEGRPLAVMEALGLGLPVVLTAQSNFPEVEVHGAGVVTGEAALASTLVELFQDAGRLRAMGAKARALFEAEFTPARTLPRLIAFYEEAIRGKQQKAAGA